MAPSKKDIARLQTIIKAASSLLEELTKGEAKTTSVKGADKKSATKTATKGARAVKKPATGLRKAPATKRKVRK